MNHRLKHNDLSCFFVSVIYSAIFFSIYFLDNNPSGYGIVYTRFFNLFISILMFFSFFYGVIYLNFKAKTADIVFFILLLASVAVTFVVRGYVNFHWIYILYAYFYIGGSGHVDISPRLRKFVLCSAFLMTLFWLFTARFNDGRPVTNWYDPNYSGFFIFVLFMLLRYERLRILSYVALVSGFFLFSRSYYLSVLLFFLLTYIKTIQEIFFRFKLNRFLVVVFIGLCVLIPIEKYFTANDMYRRVEGGDANKLLVVEDASNQARFTANSLFKKDFISNTSNYQFGIHTEEYTNNVFRNAPHNAFYTLIINYGIYFTVFYLLLYARIYDRFFTRENFPSIISLFPYYLLLGSGIQGLPGLLVFFLLALDKKRT